MLKVFFKCLFIFVLTLGGFLGFFVWKVHVPGTCINFNGKEISVMEFKKELE